MRLSRRSAIAAGGIALAAAVATYQAIQIRRRLGQPNILLIISDDQRYDDMQFMPRTQERIFDKGIAFDRAYATTSRCAPSRATILTGLYAHNHGVQDNATELFKATFAEILHEEGYYTGLIGKYLNSYPDDFDDPPKPEFDFWVAFDDGTGSTGTSEYFNPELNINGEWQEVEGYQTYILRDFALEFFEQAQSRRKPFLLVFTPYAPHPPAKPAPGDEELYQDLPRHRPPNFNEEDISDKARWLQEQPLFDKATARMIDDQRIGRAQAMHSLDLAIESLLDDLERRGLLDKTLVIYISDQGRFFGEHRLSAGKQLAYEPAARVPFAICYPGLISKPRVENRVVANVDIAPTIYELTGIAEHPDVDGRSLVPMLAGDLDAEQWREGVLLEGQPVRYDGPKYSGFHTGRYVYLEYEGDLSEFYDLEVDPYQLDNQIDNPAYAVIVEDLRSQLAEELEK